MYSCGRVFLATLILCFVVLVMAETEASEDETMAGPVAVSQLEYLSDLACFELDLLYPDQDRDCKDKFTKSTSSVEADRSELHFLCRTKTTATFKIEPGEQQLVVLVPDHNSGDIGISILNASEYMGTIYYISDSSNYKFWSTNLYNDGSHSEWRRGPDLPPWNTNGANITIGDPVFEYVDKHKRYIARINISGEINPCSTFDVTNFCNKHDYNLNFDKMFKPNITQGNQSKIEVTIEDIPIGDKCSLKVFTNGISVPVKKYHTPIPEHTHLPELATNVTMEAVVSFTGWDVNVNWARPKRFPDKYNLTLRAPGVMRSVILSGQTTKFTFQEVMGEEGARYNVTVKSFTTNGTAQTSRIGQFPPRPSYQAVILTGSWSVGLTVAAAAVGVFVWWRRRRMMHISRTLLPNEPNYPKECLMESCPESGVEDSWELRSERLLLHEVIGEGAFGVVRRGTLAPGGKDVAVKMLKGFPTVEEIRSFQAEIELMKSVGAHPHIVSLVGCCSGKRPLIVAEYCSRGDLLSFLRCSWDVMVSKRNAKYYNNNLEAFDYRNDLFRKQMDPKFPALVVNKLYDMQDVCNSELTPLDLLSFCRQIAMGMEFLASNRVVHRDLAARNILVTGDRTLKIADFGLSRDVYQENQYKQKGNGKMPVKWMALESLTHRIYTTQSDVWSFGVVIWEVVTVGGAPYPEVATARLPRLLRAGYRMPRPNNCSKQLYDVMLSCWRARPRERPTFADLHQQLDELLNSACADEYLSLELDHEPPPTPKAQRYIRMILRGNRVWARGESYERPMKGLQSNHYTTPPHAGYPYQPANCIKNSWQSPILAEQK